MEIKYNPTKEKKEKPIKAPKAEKAGKPMSFGSAQSVKIDKPKKVKKPKVKAPKPEKAVSFTPTKVEKVTDFKASGKLPKSVNPKILAAVLSVVAVIALAIAVIPFLNQVEEGGTTDIKSVVITQVPNKTEFFVGDSPSYAGLQVKVTMDNGLSFTVDQYKCTLFGFDSSKAGTQTITVTYDGVSAEYSVVIMERPGEGEGEGGGDTPGFFNGLSIKTMPKNEFKVGDWPSVEGGVLLLQYDNGDTKEIPMEIDYIYGFNTSAPGTYTVTVKYVEDGFLATTTYTITVTE